MYIKEIILDGFKSYATRTVISGFDSQFNAITGLNGSGKSNILDSICFVLGISNLGQVRVSNLQELVYKMGQAGVTKASVTLIFDNTDKKQSPVGYDQFDEIQVTRQVVIGGRNKYFINGHTAQLDRVRNLFCSVQLNVNNPHFLIMQGRITKVLNMKPAEVLGMLEEAAGTRMYETKKEAALKTIEKKNRKMDEIDAVLGEQIAPKLDTLRKDRSNYLKWTANNAECERMSRLCIAHEYYTAENGIKSADSELEKARAHIKELEAELESLNERTTALTGELKDLIREKDKQVQDELKDIEKRANDLAKNVVKYTTMWTNKKEMLESDRTAAQQLQTSAAESATAAEGKRAEAKAMQEKAKELSAKHTELSQRVEVLRRGLVACKAGMTAGDDGKQKTLHGRLEDARRLVQESQVEVDKAKLEHDHASKELQGAEKEKMSGKQEYDAMKGAVAKQTKELNALRVKIQEVEGDEDAERLHHQHTHQKEFLRELRDKIAALESRLSGLSFRYDSKGCGLDGTKVKGLVGRLINVHNAETYATAIEICAGGRLYNVIVDSEESAKTLLKKGRLERRVTIIPLDRIDTRVLPAKVVKAAERAGGGAHKVKVALSLVGAAPELQAALNYIFGSCFVCVDSETAKRVTFDPSVRARSVTVEGDVYDPSGTLTGGSKPRNAGVLAVLSELNSLKMQLESKEKVFAELEKRLDVCRAATRKREDLRTQLELRAEEVSLAEEKLRTTQYHLCLDRLSGLRARVSECAQRGADAAAAKKKAEADVKNLEKEIAGGQTGQKAQVEKLEGELSAAKEEAAACHNEASRAAGEAEGLLSEARSLDAESESLRTQAKAAFEALKTVEPEVSKLENMVAQAKQEYEEKQAEVDARKKELRETDTAIARLTKEKEKTARKVVDIEIECKKLHHKLQRADGDRANTERHLENLVKKHEWIRASRSTFGLAGTDYDFAKIPMAKVRANLAKLEEEQEALGNRINKKAMTMFEKAEQEYQDLRNKKRIVENDKAKIERVIKELDQKKNEALQRTYTKVNRDFGSIFQTLLPGTQARLDPPEGKSVLDGLEFRVAFGDCWKESLSELSGGQRSLLALSLILAMLRFKPAPLYILDEVDAALDLSHTQNIGQMLQAHFTDSQFLVVSLKEGMFGNANVIFRTKFVDGVSTVSRTVNRPSKKAIGGKGASLSDENASQTSRKRSHPNSRAPFASVNA
eukprot:Rmarinus@m.2283